MSDPVARLNVVLEGRYAIERELGEGGMATVYLAKDLKHNRNVALKVLKPELAAVVGAERFLAEIETTANLTHPHVLPLFDSGEADSFLFYVMPHIEGESLRERIDREKQLPVDEAVKITTDLAEALDYAHRHKIIHRDIKPANVLIHEGRPLIADFGIALAVGVAGGGRLTETGLSVGTPYYMSPEQATGDQAVGVATDIYALGAVLYEMLVGVPPYTGSTAQAILGKIIQGKPVSATEERASVPANVDAATRKALEKLPADRFTGAQDFARALADPGFRYGELSHVVGRTAGGPWTRLSVTFAALFVLSSAIAGLGFLTRPPVPAPPLTTRAEVTGLDVQISGGGWRFAVSPDGRWIVAGHTEDGQDPALYIRGTDQLEWRRIANTEMGTDPTFSPDGERVAFDVFGANEIRTVPITGGPTLTVASGRFPHWVEDAIVYSDRGDIYRVAASGGEPEVLFEPDGFEAIRPHLLPNGEAIVFETDAGASPLLARVMLFEIETGEVRELISSGNHPRYVPTGHLIYGHGDQALMGVPFDLETLQVTGSPVVLVSDLAVYDGGGSEGLLSPVWVERDGTAREIDADWEPIVGTAGNSSLALSPEGERLAISVQSNQTFDLWVKALDAGPLSRLTFEGSLNYRPTWSPDGRSLTFVSDRAGRQGIWTKRADGSGSADLVFGVDNADLRDGFISPDGVWLVYREGVSGDLFALRRDTDSVPVPLVSSEFSDRSPTLSPDGRWLAYTSGESGRDEVYVRPFPDVDSGRWLVSRNGGVEPVWTHSGRELLYRNGAGELIAVQVDASSSFAWGSQEILFSMAPYLRGSGHPMYDVSPDDQRFVMLRGGGVETAQGDVILVTNWFTELRERMGN